jgi:DNA-binding LacI/PurR family transcriptional regulator
MKVTIRNVAEAAQVSTSTVSRVIHDDPRISGETKRKVAAVVKRLNYHPHAVARSLANRSTKTLGIILPNAKEELFMNPFFIQAMRGISIHAQDCGYHLMYAFSKSEEEEVEFIKSYINAKWVEGVILLTVRHNDQCIAYLRSQQYPFVVIGRPEDDNDILWVDNDNFKAMHDVVNFLVDQGNREIAFIGGPLSFNVTLDRLNGYKQALLSRAIAVNPVLVAEGKDFTEEEGHRIFQKMLAERIPEAIVTTDDYLAFGVMEVIAERQLEGISVVGFNNTLRSNYQRPTLTTVDIQPADLGSKAARLLIDHLEKRAVVFKHYIIETRIIERDSTMHSAKKD